MRYGAARFHSRRLHPGARHQTPDTPLVRSLLAILLCLLLQASRAIAAPNDQNWSAEFGWPGMDGEVFALLEFDGFLIAGGSFSVADHCLCANIAAWDGSRWSPLGTGIAGTVRAMAIYNQHLIVAGDFQTAGDAAASNIAEWDGTAWRPLGQGTNGPVYTLTTHGPLLVSGGSFTMAGTVGANRVAVWDGSSWTPLGSGTNGTLRALTTYGGQLVAGGTFTQAGGAPARYIAIWDGLEWNELGPGTETNVAGLQVYEGALVAAGPSDDGGGGRYGYVARWDGIAWNPMGDPRGAAVCLLENNGTLLAAGSTAGFFPIDSGNMTSHVIRWTGTEWGGIGVPPYSAISGYANTMTVYSGQLILGGRFRHAGGQRSGSLVSWNSTAWTPISLMTAGFGVDGLVETLVSTGDRVIAGGTFTMVGATPAYFVAGWDGAGWSTFGEHGNLLNVRYDGLPTVASSTIFNGTFVIGGGFAAVGPGGSVLNVATWTTGAWYPVGPTTGPGCCDFVDVLGVHDGELYAASQYWNYFGPTNLRRFDGSVWRPVDPTFTGTVDAISSYGGFLIVAGSSLRAAGQPLPNIVQWDGVAWRPLGAGLDDRVSALHVWNGLLVAGGNFVHSGKTVVNRIAAWDGQEWSPLGQGLSFSLHAFGAVLALCEHGGRLIAGGVFNRAGATELQFVASWNGTAWSPLGSGVNSTVLSLASFQGSLYVGGAFTRAGASNSSLIARWTESPTAIRLLSSSARRAADRAVLSWELADADGIAGFRVYREEAGKSRKLLTAEPLRWALRYEFVDEAPGTEAVDYWLEALERTGHPTWHGPIPLSAAGPETAPRSLVSQPNPFHDRAQLSYELLRDGPVRLRVFDIEGALVRTLVEASQRSGRHIVPWDGRDDTGGVVPGGLYWILLETDGRTVRHKLVRAP